MNLPKRFIRALVASFATLVVGLAAGCATPVGGEPVVDVSPRHGNLLRAQELVRGAYDRLGDAQAANDSHLGGHAARAKELLREAADEIDQAAMVIESR